MVTNLFNCIFDHVARHLYIFLLSESNCARDGLTLHSRVPLQLDDEDAIRTSYVQPRNWLALHISLVVKETFNVPKTASSSCHDEYWLHFIGLELLELIFSFLKRAVTINIKILDISSVKIFPKKLQCPSPA